jgi:hypothetical protein
LTLAVLASLVATVWLWGAIKGSEPPYKGLQVVWQGVTLLWLFGLPMLFFTAVLGYVRRARATAQENRVFLQDQLWRETRREQSRNNRWLMWARLRAQRRKEGR